MFDKLVIATNNAGKLREIEHFLQHTGIEVFPQSHFNVSEAEEPYCTFIENALAKARHASFHTGLPAFADDSGLCVDALNGSPGVLSARYGGEPKSDVRNNQTLLNALATETNRIAYYYCCIILVRRHNDPMPIIAEGLWSGQILESPRGLDGFGYDPLFLDIAYGKTAAELPIETKSLISHRGQALQQLLKKLKYEQND